MSYKIKSVKVADEVLWTTVEYTLKDGSKLELEVPHFMPQDKTKVIEGIGNREISEQAKLDAKAINETIKTAINKDIADKIYG